MFMLRFCVCVVLLATVCGCTAQTVDVRLLTEESDQNEKSSGGQLFTRKSPYEYESKFRMLFLDDFEVFSESPEEAAKTWSQNGNVIHCTGTPRGYLYTKRDYSEFTLRGEYRFIPSPKTPPEKYPNANTGILCFITGEHRLWPKSVEVQGKWSEMGMVRPNGGAAMVEMTDEPESREKYRRPVGEWNRFEIIAWDGQLGVLINGVRVCQSRASDVKSGPIGIQAEGWEFELRNLRIDFKKSP